MKKAFKTLLVLGTHGQKNFGDDLLLESFLVGLSQSTKTPLKFIINSYDPTEITQKYKNRFSVRSFHTTRELFRLPFILFESDVLLFAGGSILKELYSSTGRIASSSLLMILGVVLMASLLRKRVILSHVGVSNLHHRFPRLVANIILRLADRISFRDQDSYRLACSIYKNVTAKSTIVPDVVFALPTFNDTAVEISSSEIADVLRIGLNINATIKDPARWFAFLSEVESLFVELSKRRKIEVVGVPFQNGFEDVNDLSVLTSFKETMDSHSIPCRIESPSSLIDMASIFKNMDIFVVERFHGVVLAALFNMPFFALIYDPKVSSLVASLHAEYFSADIYNKLDIAEITEKLSKLIEGRGLHEASVSRMRKDAHDSIVYLAQYVDSI